MSKKVDKTTMRADARSLKAALAALGTPLRHTAALDLVAASYGLRSRDVAGAAIAAPAQPSALLRERAAALALHDAGRLERILLATTAITHPATRTEPASPSVTAGAAGRDWSVPAHLLGDPNAFLATPEGREMRERFAAGLYYTRYYDSQRSPYDRKGMTRLAEAILANARLGERADHPLCVLEEHFGCGEEPEQSLEGQRPGFADFAEALAEAAEDADAQVDASAWEDALRESVCEDLAEADDSQVTDLLGSYDLAEVVFVFGEPDLGYEDKVVSSNEPWMDVGSVRLDENLARQLSAFGWSMSRFRKEAGRAPDGREAVATTRAAVARPLVEWKALVEALENSCSSHFCFCLYAMVPLTDLVELDLGKPVRFSKAAFASYDLLNGAFHDSAMLSDVVVKPSQGRLEAPGRWYSPDEICGLVSSHYAGRIGNAAARGR